jgi:hypothetical protein
VTTKFAAGGGDVSTDRSGEPCKHCPISQVSLPDFDQSRISMCSTIVDCAERLLVKQIQDIVDDRNYIGFRHRRGFRRGRWQSVQSKNAVDAECDGIMVGCRKSLESHGDIDIGSSNVRSYIVPGQSILWIFEEEIMSRLSPDAREMWSTATFTCPSFARNHQSLFNSPSFTVKRENERFSPP